MTRVRYYKVEENKYKTKEIVTTTDTFVVHLDLLMGNALIVSAETGETQMVLEDSDSSKLKKKVKEFLKNNGREFHDEVRRKKDRVESLSSNR